MWHGKNRDQRASVGTVLKSIRAWLQRAHWFDPLQNPHPPPSSWSQSGNSSRLHRTSANLLGPGAYPARSAEGQARKARPATSAAASREPMTTP